MSPLLDKISKFLFGRGIFTRAAGQEEILRFFFKDPIKFFRVFLFLISVRNKKHPVLLNDRELKKRLSQKRRHRKKVKFLGTKRKPMVSIALFGCNRLEFLEKNYNSFQKYLKKYGKTFDYEYIFMHDGPNKKIEQWAKKRKFDKVIFNKKNMGLYYQMDNFIFNIAKGKYLIPIQEDHVCKFEDNFIRNAIEILDENQDVGIVRIERRNALDHLSWATTKKIGCNVLSRRVFSTKSGHKYRLVEENILHGKLYADFAIFKSEAFDMMDGKLDVAGVHPYKKEGIIAERFNRFWMGARGISQKDSPFLHVAPSKGCEEWEK